MYAVCFSFPFGVIGRLRFVIVALPKYLLYCFAVRTEIVDYYGFTIKPDFVDYYGIMKASLKSSRVVLKS